VPSDYETLIRIVEIALVVSQLNCLSDEKYQLNCPEGYKCWSNERNLSLKSEFKFILIFLIN